MLTWGFKFCKTFSLAGQPQLYHNRSMENTRRLSTKTIWRYLIIGLLALLLAAAGGFVLWASNPAQPEPQAFNSFQSGNGTRFEDLAGWLVFTPADSTPLTGLILYPGGRVDPRAYAPHARAIASEGFAVIIVPMPLNFAFLGINRADEVITAFPQIEVWAIGGHSLGGAMAAEYIRNNPGRVNGLVLWAAYPGENNDLSSTTIPVLSVFGDQDGLATLDDIDSSRSRLPEQTAFAQIMGGNHAGFGWYGDQSGDGTASLDKFTQQDQIVQVTVAFLSTLNK